MACFDRVGSSAVSQSENTLVLLTSYLNPIKQIAPKYGIPKPGIPYFYTGRNRTAGESPGSEGSAAGGRCGDPSEWQRSVCNAVALSARRTPGTATGHPAPKYLPLFDTMVSARVGVFIC